MDDDMMAMMGFGGFGKAQQKKQLDPKRFDKAKRADVSLVCARVPIRCSLAN